MQENLREPIPHILTNEMQKRTPPPTSNFYTNDGFGFYEDWWQDYQIILPDKILIIKFRSFFTMSPTHKMFPMYLE